MLGMGGSGAGGLFLKALSDDSEGYHSLFGLTTEYPAGGAQSGLSSLLPIRVIPKRPSMASGR